MSFGERGSGRRMEMVHAMGPGEVRLPDGLGAPPGAWLPPPARRCGPHRWAIDLAAGPFGRSVTCQVGAVWRVGDEVWRSITWEPAGESGDLLPAERLLPTFKGELGLAPSGSAAHELRLRGAYEAPAGKVGAAADVLALHRVALGTARRFLEDVAQRLTLSPAQDERGSVPR